MLLRDYYVNRVGGGIKLLSVGVKGRKFFVTIALVGSLLVGGCACIPGSRAHLPVGAAQAQSKEPGPYAAEEIQTIAQPFLPQGARLENLGPTEGDLPSDSIPPVQATDLNGDGTWEIIAGYRVSEGSVGVLVLQEQDGDWVKVWQGDGGYALDRLQAVDITGDGCSELLVGGWIGASAGVGLEILSWDGKGLTTIARTGYHRLDVEDLAGVYGQDGKAELATWSKDTGAAMMVEVWRWNGEKLVSAEDVYQAYFPKVVAYYQELALENPQAAVLWYYLADAQLKAGDAEGAMTSIGKGMLFSNSYPGPQRFALLHGQILSALGRHTEAVKRFEELIGGWERTQGQLGNSALKRMISEAYYGRGEARLALGDEAGARADWERSRDLDQDGDKASRALQKMDLASAERMIREYLAGHPSDAGPEFAEKLMEWAAKQTLPNGKRIDLYAISSVNNTPGQAAPKVLFTDWTVAGENEPSYPRAHGLYWWVNGLLPAHVQLYAVDADQHGLDQVRLLYARQEGNKVAVAYDRAAFGSGSPCPVLYLWRLQKDAWDILWRSDAHPAWRNSHGEVQFTGSGLDAFTLTSDSWNLGDGKDQIFHESNPGPHRHFVDNWQLKDDRYVLREARTLSSSYNTLVELVYALSTGRHQDAKALVTDPKLVDEAVAKGLKQNPLGQRWMLSLDEPQAEKVGPLTILDGPATGVKVTFTKQNGRWLVDGLAK